MNVFELMGSIELKDENFIRGVENARRSMQQLQTAFNNSTRAVDRNVDRSMQNAGRSSDQGARRVETASDNMSQSLRQANRSFDSTARTASRDFEQLGTEAQRGSRRVEDSVDDAAKHSEKSVEKMSAGMIAKAQIMAQAIVGIVSKVADGAKQIATSAIEGYGNYQQLTGGIQKLYGNMGQSLIDYASANGQTVEEAKAQWQSLEKAQNTMIRNAKAGWKTAGMSANDYMQNVTGFSAALINSLGGDTLKAANVADMAMQDISDNVNTFGTGSVQDIADVYRAISKGQYQTLDNLNLGFAGTKEGMQKLIDKANELQKANGKAGELSVDSFSDIVEAIHEVQGSMSITGTTSREAMGTVEGSINMAKSAWQNFVAGLGDKDADMKQLADNLVEAGGAVLENLKPVVTQIFNSLWDIAKEEAPKLGEKIPGLIASGFENTVSLADRVLTMVQNAVSSISESDIADAASTAVDAVITAFTTLWPKLVNTGADLVSKVASGIGKALPTNIPKAAKAVVNEFIRFIKNDAGKLLKGGMDLIVGLAKGIPQGIAQLVEALPDLIDSIVDFIVDGKNIEATTKAFVELFVTGLPRAMPKILIGLAKSVPKICEGIGRLLIEGVPKMVTAFAKLFGAVGEGVKKAGKSLKEGAKSVFKKIKDGMTDEDGHLSLKEAGKNMLQALYDGIMDEDGNTKLGNAVRGIGEYIKKGLNGELDQVPDEVAVKGATIAGALLGISENLNPVGNLVGMKVAESFGIGLHGIHNATAAQMSGVASIISSSEGILKTPAEAAAKGATTAFSAGLTIKDKVTEAKETVAKILAENKEKSNRTTMDMFNELIQTARDKYSDYNRTTKSKMDEAQRTVEAAAQKMKKAFNFTFDQPKLKLPHIVYHTKHDKWLGDIPDNNSMRVEWYRKAMNAPMLLDRATIFGAAGDKYLAGGEAGPEVVSGVNPLLNMMRNAASSGNGRRDALLQSILMLLSEYLPMIGTGQDPEELFAAFDRRLGEAMI